MNAIKEFSGEVGLKSINFLKERERERERERGSSLQPLKHS